MKLNKKKIPPKSAFTLMEILIVLMGFFVIISVVLQVYVRMMNIKNVVEAKQNLIKNTYYTFEKVNIELKDFTIDYEEYFNRKMVGCNGNIYGDDFVRNVFSGQNKGYCNNFTSYGNQNSFDSTNNYGQHKFYFCSSIDSETIPETVIKISSLGSGCWDYDFGERYQSFGQYKKLFYDTKDDVDGINGFVGDGDDIDLGKGLVALLNQEDVQELYLISQDNTQRIFFRRALIDSGDVNEDGDIDPETEYLYSIQILKLRGFDAGKGHTFAINSGELTYDGQIDTWACDYSQGFVCQGDQVDETIYSGYRLPKDVDDGRVNLTDYDLSVMNRSIKIYPTKSPDLARAEDGFQINPYFTMTLVNKLYSKVRASKIGFQNLSDYQLSLQTTFNTKNFYYK